MDSISRCHLQRVVVGNEKNVKDCLAGRYPARRQLALGRIVLVSMIVRQKKAMVHTPWKI